MKFGKGEMKTSVETDSSKNKFLEYIYKYQNTLLKGLTWREFDSHIGVQRQAGVDTIHNAINDPKSLPKLS